MRTAILFLWVLLAACNRCTPCREVAADKVTDEEVKTEARFMEEDEERAFKEAFSKLTFEQLAEIKRNRKAGTIKKRPDTVYGASWHAQFTYIGETEKVVMYNITLNLEEESTNEYTLLENKLNPCANVVVVGNIEDCWKYSFLFMVDSALYPRTYMSVKRGKISYRADCMYKLGTNIYNREWVSMPFQVVYLKPTDNLVYAFEPISLISQGWEKVGTSYFLDFHRTERPLWVYGTYMKY